MPRLPSTAQRSWCSLRSRSPAAAAAKAKASRQRIRGGIARERRVDGRQLKLDLADPSVHDGERLWEYAVMVTDVAYPSRPWHSSTATALTAELAVQRLRRVEEPMGLERLHDARYQPLSDHSQSVRAGLQLVELVLQDRQPNRAHAGHHQQTPAAGRGGAGNTR